MAETTLTNEILIAAPPEKVFDYVSRPDLWHEWHPASKSAVLPRVPLQRGDAFGEIITVTYPFIKISRKTEYRVTLSERAKVWEVQGSSSLFSLTIHYDFFSEGATTRFRRTLTYRVQGLLGWFEPVVVRPKMRRQSAFALSNLKRKLEAG
ncbi:SRPBCC family protein [Turneriella parva]|uniref:Polyketide cyclase/dehydrase n=1 Tax=Turneriella parva (strain ATCC BAA-1111 / DSM 21527 / NCTC 11395 / H) TaxID=869212 RepID=I4B8Q8_TURPD|nr:SRPBCC family protein [Turneriella parva]AFM13665.1 Polyketide cyclase/dehydrase [Turneriella parva DSM 21527]